MLKECEDFSGGVNTNASVSLNGTSGENITVGYGAEEGEEGVDINQWISEEIHNYIIPKVSAVAFKYLLHILRVKPYRFSKL